MPLHEEKGCDADAEEADRCRDHQRHLQRGQVTTRRRGAPRRRRRRTGNGTRLGRSIFRLHRRLQIHVAEVVRVATLSEPDAGNGQNGGGGSGEKKEVPGLPGRVKGGPGDTDG